jgi:hypothetical protein
MLSLSGREASETWMIAKVDDGVSEVGRGILLYARGGLLCDRV